MSLRLSRQFEIWAFISTRICGCGRMFPARYLRQNRSIRRSVTRPVLQTLVAALTLTRLDYGCLTMAGLPARQLNRLQSVRNAAARLVYSENRARVSAPQ